MSDKHFPIEYTTLNDALLHSHTTLSAAEAHGMLCGFICAGHNGHGQPWLAHILEPTEDGDVVAKEAAQGLFKLYQFSSEQLHEMAFDFQLLLPAEDDGIAERAEALGQWCQGFMAGLGLAGLSIKDGPSEFARDALLHFSEIAKIDYHDLVANEQDERAFEEVFEYVRMAVLTIFSEFSGTSKFSAEDDEEDKTRH